VAESTSAAEIHWQLFEVYHDNVMNHQHFARLHDRARPPYNLRNGSHFAAICMGVSHIHCTALTWHQVILYLFDPAKKITGGRSFQTDAEMLEAV
jgi:hypothetical protein